MFQTFFYHFYWLVTCCARENPHQHFLSKKKYFKTFFWQKFALVKWERTLQLRSLYIFINCIGPTGSVSRFGVWENMSQPFFNVDTF
jgi:hypothetical protein